MNVKYKSLAFLFSSFFLVEHVRAAAVFENNPEDAISLHGRRAATFERERNQQQRAYFEEDSYLSPDSSRNLILEERVRLRLRIHHMMECNHDIYNDMKGYITRKGCCTKFHDFIKTTSLILDIVGGSVIGLTSGVELNSPEKQDSLNKLQCIFGTSIAVLKGIDWFIERQLQHSESSLKAMPSYKEEWLNHIMENLRHQYPTNDIKETFYEYLNIPKERLPLWLNGEIQKLN
jgi:hypothetical protein